MGTGGGGVSTSTSHTASVVQPIPVVRTPTAAGLITSGYGWPASHPWNVEVRVIEMSTEVRDSTTQHICQSGIIPQDQVHQQQYKSPKGDEVGDVSRGYAAQHRLNFQRIYESAFNEALNTKRSACEQSAGKIVQKTMAEFEKSGEEFFTIDEVSTLRRANTGREQKAFFWFFGEYVECVSGKRLWGRKKVLELVSKVKDYDGGRNNAMVTKSDQAFALLIFENYKHKWKLQREKAPVHASNAGTTPRMKGKYTGQSSGHCEYGGWSTDGIKRFNKLRTGGGRQSMPPR